MGHEHELTILFRSSIMTQPVHEHEVPKITILFPEAFLKQPGCRHGFNEAIRFFQSAEIQTRDQSGLQPDYNHVMELVIPTSFTSHSLDVDMKNRSQTILFA